MFFLYAVCEYLCMELSYEGPPPEWADPSKWKERANAKWDEPARHLRHWEDAEAKADALKTRLTRWVRVLGWVR